MPFPSSIPESYINLALALEQHIDGYVDCYFGPPEWRTESQAAGKRPIAELTRHANDLASALATDSELAPTRRAFLAAQLRAMHTSLALLNGETMTLTQETQALYDLTPLWRPESTFAEAHKVLDDLLPGSGPLPARMNARRDKLSTEFAAAEPLIPNLLAGLRARTAKKFPLPPGESFDFAAVNHKPWAAYNWYLGNYHSLIEWNTDLPASMPMLPAILAHEGYPGHHTEHCIKEQVLVSTHGWQEHTITLLNSPECVIAEAIATTALDMVYTPQEQIELNQNVLYPALGVHLDAAAEAAIDHAAEMLKGVRPNAAFLLHDEHQTADRVIAYLKRYGLMSDRQAAKAVEFQSNPLYRSYIFTYTMGKDLLQQLFQARGNPDQWFARLLAEPVTPTQIRSWISDASA